MEDYHEVMVALSESIMKIRLHGFRDIEVVLQGGDNVISGLQYNFVISETMHPR